MEDDLKVCTTTYKESEAVKVALAGDVNFFDNFHLSPLKVNKGNRTSYDPIAVFVFCIFIENTQMKQLTRITTKKNFRYGNTKYQTPQRITRKKQWMNIIS